jgi:hypothetical protein
VEVVNDGRGELTEAQRQEMIFSFKQIRRKNYLEGFAPALATNLFINKYHMVPEDAWCLGSIFGKTPNVDDQDAYRRYLETIAKRQGKTAAWITSEYQKEFGTRD